MKRTSKRYVITTSAVNCYKYRVLSSGVDFSQYLRNPILLWMHMRSSSEKAILPIGRAVEIRLEGDKWTCYLEFDENDTFAMSIYNKYEAGILSMLSIGAIPIDTTFEPSLMLAGQDGPTVVRCKVTDVSCVDLGANDEAVVELYNEHGGLIALSRGNISPLVALATNANKFVTPLNHSHSTLQVIENAVAAGKFTTPEASKLHAFPNTPAGIKQIFDKVKAAKIDPLRLEGKIPEVLMPLLPKSWGELESNFGDGIRLLKEHAPDVYKAKHFEKHGRLPATKSDGKPY